MPGPAYLYSGIKTKLSLLRRGFSSSVQYLRACSQWKVPPRYIPVLVVLLILAALSMSGNLLAQNGITANQDSVIATSPGSDSLWADTADGRWKVNNNGTGPQDLAVWPCATAGIGGLVYGGALNSFNVDPESCLSLPNTTPPGVPLLVGVLTPIAWGGTTGAGPVTSLDLQDWAEVTEVTNTSPGTGENLLAKIITTGATEAGTGDIEIPTYIVVAGAGSSGNAQMAVAGQAACKMDSNNTVSSVQGDPVVTSPTTPGECHVVTSGTPSPGYGLSDSWSPVSPRLEC
jgi:hypothetical protein